MDGAAVQITPQLAVSPAASHGASDPTLLGCREEAEETLQDRPACVGRPCTRSMASDSQKPGSRRLCFAVPGFHCLRMGAHPYVSNPPIDLRRGTPTVFPR